MPGWQQGDGWASLQSKRKRTQTPSKFNFFGGLARGAAVICWAAMASESSAIQEELVVHFGGSEVRESGGE